MTGRKLKNNRIRIGALLMAVLLSFSMLAGCGGSKKAGSGTGKPSQSQS